MGSSGINRVHGGDLPARVVDSSEKTNMSSESDYPPNGLADSVKKLPEWIQKGCCNDEYVCEEKGVTFLGGNMPAECPDLRSKRAVVTTNTSVKKKVSLSSGVICQPSAQIFLSTIHSSLRISHQSFTTSSRIKRPNLVLHWVIASKLVSTTQVIP